MTIWKKMQNCMADDGSELQAAYRLLELFKLKGSLPFTCQEALQISDTAITHFYAMLAGDDLPTSPVSKRPHSGWMADRDFCFFNIRATGIDHEMGNFIQASKLLPIVRANAIHIGPFTDYDFENIYAVRSVQTISPKVISTQWLSAGFSPADQLRAFVEAAHLLGKTVGFDVEPHLAQYARVVLEHPHLFRWYHLAEDKRGLKGGLTSEEMVREDQQQMIIQQVSEIVQSELQARKLDTLEYADGDNQTQREHKDQTYFGLIGKLIERGFWPIPSQVWSADGVPAFKEYNFSGNYAAFDYRSRTGEDHGQYAYHVMTPIKLYENIPANRCPLSNEGQLLQAGVDFFSSIFLKWRDEFDFDFVRYDSVDHIFDSIQDNNPALPRSDRPTPQILKTCIQRSRADGKPYIGNFAERMGLELDAYAALGYDLILGTDMLQQPNRQLVETSFWIYDQLQRINQGRSARFAVPFCVDTHDTGNEHIWGEPLIKISGSQRMRLRHFLSRFIHCGLARRPKYEVIGAQDLSFGLYRSNVSDVNLTWVGDREYNRAYHTLEDIYELFAPILSEGVIQQRYVDDRLAWWMISSEEDWLLAVASLDNGEMQEHLLPRVEIPLPPQINCLVRFDFSATLGFQVPFQSPLLVVDDLPYLGFRLYHGSKVVEE